VNGVAPPAPRTPGTAAEDGFTETLVLFDIDGTLLRTQGAGMAAMVDALRELHPSRDFSFDGIAVAGRLDTLIWHDLAARHDIDPSDASQARFRTAYARHLERQLDARADAMRVMPGVPALLEHLRREADIHLGVLTGNYSDTGRLKIRRCGLDADLFVHNAWAEDGESRRALPPVAMRRFRERTGRNIPPDRTVIIGDTPHDVDCAVASGCRVIAVATGDFPKHELEAHGAHLALSTLEATASIVDWLRHGGPRTLTPLETRDGNRVRPLVP